MGFFVFHIIGYRRQGAPAGGEVGGEAEDIASLGDVLLERALAEVGFG